jgi:16S rRNA (cytidine1402-2'-O)-methyltransferase
LLYIVATPIGNLEDITLRALRILKEVDLVAAEDTRQTLKLLNHFDLSKPLTSYYEHNKAEKGNYLIEQLLDGKNIALVSDAGTPGISDPGEELVKMAVNNGITVTMTPGPVAAIMALVLSALPSGRFAFEGFLPMNKRSRKEKLSLLKDEMRTLVLYEAPHKLIYTLKDLYQAFGNRRIVLARELTKKFEEIIRCSLADAIEKYDAESPRGEYVLVIEGRSAENMREEQSKAWMDMSLEEHVRMYMDRGLDKKEAMKTTAEDRGISKRDVYNGLLRE